MTLKRRMTVTAAVAVLLTSTVLYPVFTDSVWFAASIGAVITVAATGALTRLRSLPVTVCLAAGVVALLLYLNLVFEHRHSLLLVIPTPASISRLWHLVGTGMYDARKYAPPVPNVSALLFLTVAGVGITAVVTDLIAVRLRSTALAGLPLLVLFTVPVMVNAPHSDLANPLVFCLAGAGYLAMLSADGRERIRVWGRLISVWRSGSHQDIAGGQADGSVHADVNGASVNAASVTGEGRVRAQGLGLDTRALATAGRRVGLASIVLALFAPLLVPGLHSIKVFPSGPGIGGTGTGTGALSLPGALSQAVSDLHDHHPSVVFTYTTTASASLENSDAQYFRQYVFDTLSPDKGWQVTGFDAGAAPLTAIPNPQGLSNSAVPLLLKTTVKAGQSFPSDSPQPNFLPLIYPVAGLDVHGKWLADSDLMVYSTDSSIAGQTYTETSLDVDPSSKQLEQLGVLANTGGLGSDLALPDSYKTSALKDLAEKYAGGQSTELGQVNALATRLSERPFRYSLSGPLFWNADGLLSFLTKTKSGYCIQYAFAMTVLTRLLGIPARFVVGYTAGTQVKGDEYEVENTDAHAWTEVYFPTFGWLRFEPTPAGQGTAQATNYMSNAAGSGQISPGVPIDTATAAPGAQNPGQNRNPFGRGRTELGTTNPVGTVSAKSGGTPWAAIALAVIAAIALACGVIAMVAPPAERAPSHSASPARRRRPVSAASVVLITVAAALIALALYRVLSRASSLRLGADWAAVGIAFGAAVAVALIAPSMARLALRRWRWMHAADDDASRAHVAWREFRDDLSDFGVGCRASDPPRTLAARVTAGLPEPAADAIRRLALAEEHASYAARPSGSADLRRDGGAARRGLAASAGRGTRLRARIFPASLMTALADVAAGIPDFLAARLARRRTASDRP